MCSPEHITLQRDARAESASHLKTLLADKNELIYQHIYDAYPSLTDNLYAHLSY